MKFIGHMKKSVLLLFIACSLYLNAAAQQRQDVYFLKNNGMYVDNVDSADYIRVVQDKEKGALYYLTKEIYLNGNKKSLGYSSTINPPKYEGQFISYFENGRKKQLINYNGGKITDTVYSYYPNGNLYSAKTYSYNKDSTISYIRMMRDSSGKELVVNGKGNAVIYDDNFTYIMGKGPVADGVYDGEWLGEIRDHDTLTYKETYANGKLLSGESNDGKGNVYHYTIAYVKPGYEGGMNNFYKYLSRQVRYPPNMVSQRIQGKPEIEFTIYSDGRIGNIHPINHVHPELSAEAMRVIKLSKGWDPGMQKGRKVNVFYRIPISFSLSH